MPPKKAAKEENEAGTKRAAADSSPKDEPPNKKTHKESDTTEQPRVLEKGHIYFLYRPKMDTDSVNTANDVQRVYMVLKPYWQHDTHARVPTLIILGRKRLPSVKKHERFWAFVGKATKNLNDLSEAFKKETYETKTRGERTTEPSRPMGEGVYEIVTHGQHSHLAYMLTVPSEPQEVQDAFNIDKEASIVISVKNPLKSSPPQGGLGANQKAEYPERLQKLFADRRFAPLETTTEFLNHDNCELMMIGAAQQVKRELGKAGETLENMEEKDEEHVEYVGADKSVFEDLKLAKKENPVEALQGQWT